MCLTDKLGNVYAHRSTIKAGDRVRADGGFTCLKEGSIHTVLSTTRDLSAAANPPFESLFIECDDGKHMLDGQLDFDGDGALVGLYPV